jgi:hypothetical protein
MSETREQAVAKLHNDLNHSGEAEACVQCANLATTLGWARSGRRSLAEKAKDEQ